MRCPHCDKVFPFFTLGLKTKGPQKLCPHCNKTMLLYFNSKVAALWFALLFPLQVFIFKPTVIGWGYNGTLSTGIVAATWLYLSLRLKKPGE
ncbi:hypothetical protein G3R49_01935 [Shewanella sp. WXL01]|uniref:CXXC-20-CXXC protein n=1 Tax=Shewanella maritima TaxID=2520507 RepID=A0A411PG11_9GAMM|nr:MULTISPECIES: hypothetical protein [Shewanella]NKF49340.1 hypothetical protein [Shewanella sp. WXL01]QBF82536.1 hypothetical protein EXU30_07380 [Shewanella maritima]